MKLFFTLLLLNFYGWVWSQQIRAVDYVHSSVSFKIRNAGIGVDGHFSEYSAAIVFDPQSLAQAKFDGKIKVASIDTGINARNNHLKKDDFFDVAKYPDMSFHSTAVKVQGAGYLVQGKLTIKDVTKEVSIPLTITKEGNTEIFSGQLNINRLDYHVGEDSWVMSDDVSIAIKIATK